MPAISVAKQVPSVVMDLQSVVANIGSYTQDAVLISAADPSDGATLRMAWLNPAFTELTGYSEEDIADRTLGFLACDETDPADHAQIIDRLSNWLNVESDIVIGRKDGTHFWCHLRCQPLADEEGLFRFWICILRDITDRKIAADQKRDLSLIAETTQDMVIVMDENRRCTWVNPSFKAFTGFTLKDVAGKRMSEFITPADDAAVQDISAKLDRHEAVFTQILCHKADGTLYLGEFEFQPILNDLGVLERYVSLHRDVTEKHSLETRYASLINAAGLMCYIKHDGRFVLVNSDVAKLFGRSTDWFLDRSEKELSRTAGRGLFCFDEEGVLKTGHPYSGECEIENSDGLTRTYWVHAFRILDPTLNDHLLCCVAHDITSQKETEHNLRRTQNEAVEMEARLRGAIDAMADGFVLYDRDDVIVMCNQAFRDMHGALGPYLQAGVHFEDGVYEGLRLGVWDPGARTHDEFVADYQKERQRLIGQEQLVEFADGRWMLLKNIPLNSGEIVGLRFDLTDIKKSEVALKAAQTRAELAQSRLEAAIEALDDAFLIFDPDDRLIMMNSKAYDRGKRKNPNLHLGATFEEIIQGSIELGQFANAKGREEDWIRERLEHHRNPTGTLEVSVTDGRHYRVLESKTDHGDTVTLRVDITREREQQIQLEEIAADLRISRDLAEQRNRDLEDAKCRIEHASLHDALTGLANRRYLDQILDARMQEATHARYPLAALHIDLDRFKQINDTMGHAAGDAVLRHVADVLQTETRTQDFAARVGGDEFVIITEEGPDPGQLAKFAARLVERMNQPLKIGKKEVRYGASVGIAVADDDLEDPRELLINADMALYRAKDLGRNCWAYFSKELQAEIREKKILADEILEALDRNEFHAHYQPQFDAATHSVSGVEALVRWENPQRGTLHPDSFLPVASELGVLRRIDQAVLFRVIEDRKRWEAAGVEPPRVSVNISGHRLREPELLEDIRAAGFPPGALTIELLESIFLDEADSSVDWTIDQLREMGVGVELDDFGTGHSSIVGLIKLNPDGLKIDRQFVIPITASVEKAALVRSIIEIGHSLGVQVVAEGVETLEHARILADLNCNILQGYAFAKPMNSDDLIRFLQTEPWRKAS